MNWQIPVKTEFMKEQSKHQPSMRYAENIHEVASGLPKGFTALEIGAAWGFSTLAILEAGCKSLMSVDNNTLAEGSNEAIANGYADQHSWNVCRSEQFWAENPSARFDLIYVDGSHLYKDVKLDLYEGWDRLNAGGLLLADDWDHPKNIKAENDTSEYGVSLACFEFWRDNYAHVKSVRIEGRVLVFGK
jgi:predicted O-methyltransferase YrrM